MRIVSVVFSAVITLSLLPVPSMAQSKSGLSYTKTQKSTTAPEAEPLSDTAQGVWDKYEALIKGENVTPKDTTKAKTMAIKPVTPIKEIKSPKQQIQKKTTGGITDILKQYEAKKKSRSKMRSITIRKAEPTTDIAEEATE